MWHQCDIRMPSLLMVSLSIPFNKLPWSYVVDPCRQPRGKLPQNGVKQLGPQTTPNMFYKQPVKNRTSLTILKFNSFAYFAKKIKYCCLFAKTKMLSNFPL